jgi:excisionase family DNA binding protein
VDDVQQVVRGVGQVSPYSGRSSLPAGATVIKGACLIGIYRPSIEGIQVKVRPSRRGVENLYCQESPSLATLPATGGETIGGTMTEAEFIEVSSDGIDDKDLLTKQGAVDYSTGQGHSISTRQLERYAEKGKLEVVYKNGRHGRVAHYRKSQIDKLISEIAAQQGVVTIRPALPPALDMPVSEVVKTLVAALKEVVPQTPTLPALTLSVKEVAALTGFTQKYVMTAIAQGNLRVEMDGQRKRIFRKDVEEWIEKIRHSK